ncbi:MAG: hypothetical protein KDC44_00630, partial [Phaeodactylibacter sp.]|nr:hypothetical protein [Phaeodactylibacter sp.]
GASDADLPSYQTAIFQVLASSAAAPADNAKILPITMDMPPDLGTQQLGGKSTYSDAALPSVAATTPELSPVSHYGPGFSAYYQNSSSVFGLHDNLSDVVQDLNRANFSVSYQVIGWYADEADDLLNQLLTAAKAAYGSEKSTAAQLGFFYDFVEKELEWQLPAETATTGDWPAAAISLYNGLAFNI